jgi:hypothetical protein
LFCRKWLQRKGEGGSPSKRGETPLACAPLRLITFSLAHFTTNNNPPQVIDFIEKARLGEPIPNEVVIRIARLFKDELTLANIARPQLVSMCQYMGLPPYGADVFLRFQLRTKLRAIKEDDRRILWEGIQSLNTLELQEACNEFYLERY